MSEFLCECGKKARPTTVKIKMDNGLINFSVEMKVCFYCWVDIQSAVVDGNFRKLLVSSPQAETPKANKLNTMIEHAIECNQSLVADIHSDHCEGDFEEDHCDWCSRAIHITSTLMSIQNRANIVETPKDAASEGENEYLEMLVKACAELKRRNGNIENNQLQCWYSLFPASNKKEQGE